ncbi:MAG: hypothetical protein COA49_01760 [Bacteroidetes bacterium]|nr:MAG: hypothetical protein COA49_01760 [Bacteroidota bacterium]
MKLFFSTLFSLVLCVSISAQSSVTFQVDMSVEGANPMGVFIAGSFQGWTPGASQMLDPDGDGIFTYTAIVDTNTTIQWKYLNGASWGMEETVPPACGNPLDNNNRSLDVGILDVVIPPVCYGSCQACGTIAITTDVTLTVLTSNITVAVDGMFLAGSLNGWTGEPMVDNGDGSWSITKALAATSYDFKFQNGANGWEELACGGNRSFTFLENDPAFSVVGCFGQCSDVCVVDPTPAAITFSVDASQITVDSTGIFLLGSFTTPAWQAGAIPMLDLNGDGIYTVTTMVSGPADIQYKFNNGDPFPMGVADYTGEEGADFLGFGCGVDNGVGGSNRSFTRSGLDESTPAVCFNSCVACALIQPVLVFTVDLCGASATEVRLTGALWNWDLTLGPLATDNGDGTWSVTFDPAPTADMDYLWIVDGIQEDLLNEAIAGGTCAPITDLTTYARRSWVLGSADPSDVFGQCGACAGIVLGCMYSNATNYNASANDDDGSCIFPVTSTCLGDVDGDNLAGTSDLLMLLAGFGSICP